jgi:hypothetical protein
MTSLTFLGFCNFVAIDFNDLILVEKLEQVLFGVDRAPDRTYERDLLQFRSVQKRSGPPLCSVSRMNEILPSRQGSGLR